MQYILFQAIALCALFTSAQAQAEKEPLRLKQTSQWNVDYGDERCRLIRKFGEGEQHVYAIFDQFGPGDYFRITLAGKSVSTAVLDGEVSIQFGPNEAEQRMGFYKGDLGKDPAMVFQIQGRLAPLTAAELSANDKAKNREWTAPAPISVERQAAIRTLTIGKPLRRTVILETGPMRKPLEAMGTCIDTMIASWGVDVERHKKLTRAVEPTVSPGKWVVSNDYPEKMLSQLQSAIVEFRLSIDTEGNPTQCVIQLTTRQKEFDKAVCDSLMRRAKFLPALDEEGKPLASYYRNSVQFAIR